jgi:hypothetical protein
VAVACRLTWAVAAAVLAVCHAAPAWAAHPPAPTSINQALHDGCQRSIFGIGFDTSPEWIYICRGPAIRMAEGIVRVAHGSLQDSILEHRSFDFTANLVPDPAFRYLIAGSRSQRTNNFAPGGGDELGRLHFEWESATMPLFAWPTDGDRATVWGSWSWDCGHWTSAEKNTSGAVTGEHSELHPLSAIAVARHAPYLSARGESETDVFVSNEGDGAHAVEKCALSHHPLTGASYAQYDAGFKSCATSVANRLQLLARTYSFFVAAPPRPSASARLQYRIVNRISGGSGSQRVRNEANGIEVTVTLHGASHEVRYGKSFFVSWSGPIRHAAVPLAVTLKSILIKQADPNPALPDPTGTHWNLYVDLNGYWQLLNQWAPRLTTNVIDNERITINRTVKIYVPRGSGVWLQVAGRECDEPAAKVVLGIYANPLYPCPANTDEQNPNIVDIFNNDDTGTILDTYRSAGAAIGTHVSTSVPTTHRFPGSGSITFGDGKQGRGDYQLTYTVRRG